jgi:hypothetical protein
MGCTCFAYQCLAVDSSAGVLQQQLQLHPLHHNPCHHRCRGVACWVLRVVVGSGGRCVEQWGRYKMSATDLVAKQPLAKDGAGCALFDSNTRNATKRPLKISDVT